MPDLGGLTDAQRSALNELELAISMYRDAVASRIEAQRREDEARLKFYDLSYVIAGVS